jgi:glycosyltransferase involved in cell wall biosynthesis
MTTVIIIPCYNEANRIDRQAFIDFSKENPSIAFLFVNDGSKDNTLEILSELTHNQENLHLLNLEKNGGKAEAVRNGMLHANNTLSPTYIGFWDADLATPLNEIPLFVKWMQKNDYEIITGLRLMRLGASVVRKKSRHYFGRVFATVTANMLKISVYDTQCGAKLYKSEVVPALFEEKFTTRWLFDVELLARYIRLFGHQAAKEKIYEYPIFSWEDIQGSQLKMKDFIKAPLELLKIKRRYLNKK